MLCLDDDFKAMRTGMASPARRRGGPLSRSQAFEPASMTRRPAASLLEITYSNV
jgi:hypothetical protein